MGEILVALQAAIIVEMNLMGHTYLTTAELAERIKYTPRTIRNQLLDYKLLEGVHYIRPFGGRKILFLWEKIEEDMQPKATGGIPMAAGGVCRG